MKKQKLSKSSPNENTPKESDLEICVSCGDITNVKKSTPIDQRRYYVEGGGQLDEKCYLEIYKNIIWVFIIILILKISRN